MEFTGKVELVKKVQTLLKIKVDGVDGSDTWNAILDSFKESSPKACVLFPQGLCLHKPLLFTPLSVL